MSQPSVESGHLSAAAVAADGSAAPGLLTVHTEGAVRNARNERLSQADVDRNAALFRSFASSYRGKWIAVDNSQLAICGDSYFDILDSEIPLGPNAVYGPADYGPINLEPISSDIFCTFSPEMRPSLSRPSSDCLPVPSP